jgi:hypothetical protein
MGYTPDSHLALICRKYRRDFNWLWRLSRHAGWLNLASLLILATLLREASMH